MSFSAKWLMFLSFLSGYGIVKPESKLSCWTLNVTADRTSYLYWYRGNPEQFVLDLTTSGSPPVIPHTDFNSSVYVLGALATDNDEPISLFVHDKISGYIYRFAENLMSLSLLFKGTSKLVEDMAVDWLSHNVYYTDPLVGIGLVSYSKQFAIIIHKVAALHGIDVDPMSQLLFFADGDTGHIYQASLTGENVKVLSGSDTRKPTALVTDAVSKRLFWLDEGTQYLQSWNYATSEFRQLWNSYTVGVGLFTGIDLYEPYLFISLKNEQRMRVVTTNGTEVLSFSPSNGTGSRAYGIAISSSSRQPHIQSHCRDNNGGCQHICIHVSNIASECLCQFGYASEGKTCQSGFLPNRFLLFSDVSSNTIYQVDTVTHSFHTFHTTSEPNVSPECVAFDPQELTVYWTDRNGRVVWRKSTKEAKEEQFIDLGYSSIISSMAVDSNNGHLYYTDTKLRRIGTINLSTKMRKVVLQLTADEKPGHLQLDVARRTMYWTDGGKTAKIEKADMADGTKRQVLIEHGLMKLSGLALDFSDFYMYWVDEETQRIERAKLDGSQKELFTLTPAKYNGLTLDGSFLYLSEERSLVMIGKTERNIEKLGPEYFVISGLLCYSSDYMKAGETTRPIGLNGIIIVGLVTGGVLVLAVIIAVTCILIKRRNNETRTNVETRRNSTSQHSYEDIRLEHRPGTQAPRGAGDDVFDKSDYLTTTQIKI